MIKLETYLQKKAEQLNSGELYEVFVTNYIHAVRMVDAGFSATYQYKFHRYQITTREYHQKVREL